MVFYKATLAGALALALTGCVTPAKTTSAVTAPAKQCLAGDAMTQTTLYFGISRPTGAEITANEWRSFVDKDVTPRFREGLTEYDAKGQWLNAKGEVTHEPSKAIMLIRGSDAESSKKVDELRSIYKTRFAQESVMRIDQPVCAAF
ncbi:DUF3574 domain-containing protein [Enterobacter sp. Cy-643]|uniref:DUF3574 domain-containing protein n=1 Tax=Enterobacter sp. Cy-643 TaxID=2608346 RepID=UPI001422B9B4|nr:DUF3574 domain-containing protein [Enterobacter sp. Cy-643]NIF31300.1 DUF3574 domain-containing protein [Enterobacter sp. Cy-643]